MIEECNPESRVKPSRAPSIHSFHVSWEEGVTQRASCILWDAFLQKMMRCQEFLFIFLWNVLHRLTAHVSSSKRISRTSSMLPFQRRTPLFTNLFTKTIVLILDWAQDWHIALTRRVQCSLSQSEEEREKIITAGGSNLKRRRRRNDQKKLSMTKEGVKEMPIILMITTKGVTSFLDDSLRFLCVVFQVMHNSRVFLRRNLRIIRQILACGKNNLQHLTPFFLNSLCFDFRSAYSKSAKKSEGERNRESRFRRNFLSVQHQTC